ncbi:MAG: nucleoside monophosphate kinase [Phycisphaerales bacterium]
MTTSKYKAALLFGSPGAGKGTQGEMLGKVPGFFHVSTGDAFRALDPDTEIGKTFNHYSTQGLLVPDDVTIGVWQEYMRRSIAEWRYNPETQLLVLDGIPRNPNQAGLMDEHIDTLAVVHLTCRDPEPMLERLSKRALKSNRPDDAKPEVVRKRWDVYIEETRPVLDHYDETLVTDIDALGTPAEVFAGVLGCLAPIQAKNFKSLF